MSEHVKRKCELCGQVDDHPHLVSLEADGQIISGHHDCHAENGHPVAQDIVNRAEGKQGHELRAFLQSGAV